MPVVEYKKIDRIAFVTLNRPEAMNAVDDQVSTLVREVFADIEADDSLVVVLAGEGGRAFSAGMDLKWRAGDAGGIDATRDEALKAAFDAVGGCSKPLIAAIDGYCLAGGMQLAARCDIRVATVNSTFGMPEARRGLTAVGMTDTPEVFFPPGEASLILLTGTHYPAQRAYEMGFIQSLAVDRTAMWSAVSRIAEDIKLCAPLAVVAIKSVLKMRQDMPTSSAGVSMLDRLLALNRDVLDRNAHSADRLEGPAAFAQKRPPQWRGR
jgi:enoyl-CoA hydratase/carnithine racemase